MPDDRERFQNELEHEVARLRDLALKSTDLLIVAKGIAASDSGVQELILARLTSGERLVEVIAFSVRSNTEVRVFFRFVPIEESVHVLDTGLLAFVDIAKGEVIGTADPFVLQPEHRAGRPFVAVSALNPRDFAASEEATRSLRDRQETFFKQLGLAYLMRDDGFGGIATVKDTVVRTSTWSGNPRRSDDSQTEGTDDYVDCAPGIGGILA